MKFHLSDNISNANRFFVSLPLDARYFNTFRRGLANCQCRELICYCLFHPSHRLKKKSQSVDIASQGFSPTLLPASPLNRVAPPVAKATAGLGVQDNNTTNSQHRSPRCGELKRGYTIGK